MDINELTIREAREIAALVNPDVVAPFRVGAAYLIRTVTMTWTGRVHAIVGQFLVLNEAAWVADTGRYHLATCTENLSEVEPAGDGVIVGLGAIVDGRPWTSALPKDVK
jgi:hypothetical protein